jgi:tetratricopeptide (TPR) repeat protein
LLGLALAQQGRCLVRLHEYARAAEVLQEAAGRAEATGSAPLALLVTRVQGELLFEQGSFVEAGAAFRRAAAQERAGGLAEPAPGTRLALGAAALELGHLDEARDEARAAQAQARAGRDRLAESEALALLAAVDARRGDFAAAEAGLERAMVICQGLGAPLYEARVMAQLGGVLSTGPRRFGAAGRCFGAALDLARPAGESFAGAVLLPAMGRNARLRGDLDQAAELARQALATCREVGRRAGEGAALRDLGMLSHYRDDDRQALRLGQEALQIALETGSPWARRDALILVGHAAAGVGQTATAAGAYEQALALDRAAGVRQQEIEALAGCARVALARGDLVHAASAAATVLDFLAATPSDGAEEPVRLYLTCARVLEALGDQRAPGLVGAAYTLLEEQAEGLGAGEREALLQRLPAHRAVAAAWQAQQEAAPAGPAVQAGSRS